MATTITLYDIVESELQRKGLNEFVNDAGEWVAFDNDYQFIQKMLQYDADVSEIVNRLFFGGVALSSDYDEEFKRIFFLNFMNREIAYQSVETFTSKVITTLFIHESYIQNVYESADKFIMGTQENDQSNQEQSHSTNITNNRQAFAELPQNLVNLDLQDTTMDYASDNTISRNSQTSEQTNENDSEGTTKNFQLDNLIKSNGLLQPVFESFDKRCFLQTW